MIKRKIVQVQAAKHMALVLCDDGTVWSIAYGTSNWRQWDTSEVEVADGRFAQTSERINPPNKATLAVAPATSGTSQSPAGSEPKQNSESSS